MAEPWGGDHDCPWGCGLPLRHPRSERCPPADPARPEAWANGPGVALGTARQLREDVAALRVLRAGLPARDPCWAVLAARINVIERRLAAVAR